MARKSLREVLRRQMTDAADDLRTRVEGARWYHAMRLPGDIVTPGDYDLEDTVARVPLPQSLAGKRCLDVGTRDGFWAFEMERRGGSEVVAIDLDDPDAVDWPGARPQLSPDARAGLDRREPAFEIAHDALGSSVERRNLSVYDLDAGEVGQFDFAFIGTLLLHLRDPVGALTAIERVLRSGGQLISNDPIALAQTLLHPRTPYAVMQMRGGPFWWVGNLAARRRMMEAAGFEVLAAGRPYLMRYGTGWQRQPLPRRPSELRELPRRLLLRRGAIHAWVLGRAG